MLQVKHMTSLIFQTSCTAPTDIQNEIFKVTRQEESKVNQTDWSNRLKDQQVPRSETVWTKLAQKLKTTILNLETNINIHFSRVDKQKP